MVRIKNRYILAQFMPTKATSSLNFSTLEIQNALREKIQELYGEIGVGTFGNNTFVKYHEDNLSNIFIVRTSRDDQQKVQLALNCLGKIKEDTFVIRTLSVKSCARTCSQQFDKLYRIVVSNQDRMDEEEKAKVLAAMENNLLLLEM